MNSNQQRVEELENKLDFAESKPKVSGLDSETFQKMLNDGAFVYRSPPFESPLPGYPVINPAYFEKPLEDVFKGLDSERLASLDTNAVLTLLDSEIVSLKERLTKLEKDKQFVLRYKAASEAAKAAADA